MIQLVFAVQRLQVGEVLLEDVDVGLQERLAERLEEEEEEGVMRVVVSAEKKEPLTASLVLTCMAAVNWASFSMLSSGSPLWTLVKTDVLKKYLQF